LWSSASWRAASGSRLLGDTGAAHEETFAGRIYRLEIDRDHPARASIHVLIDADAGADMFNPDNLAVSNRALVIREVPELQALRPRPGARVRPRGRLAPRRNPPPTPQTA
jgi:hypothetical protein